MNEFFGFLRWQRDRIVKDISPSFFVYWTGLATLMTGFALNLLWISAVGVLILLAWMCYHLFRYQYENYQRERDQVFDKLRDEQ
jgi:membrane protein implicated in regulation of membrane protease activity